MTVLHKQVMPSNRISNDYKGVSELAKQRDEPIIITKNGYTDFIVMSLETYNTKIGEGKLHDTFLANYLEFQTNRISHDIDDTFDELIANLRKKNV